MIAHKLKRSQYKPTTQKADAEFNEKFAQFIEQRKKKEIPLESGLQRSEEIISRSPDCTTAWNFRRDSLDHLLLSRNSTDCLKLLSSELDFTLQAIMKNPKIYCHWEYRRHALSSIFSLNLEEQDLIDRGEILKKEFKLTVKLLQLDGRNFHCWNHRQWFARLVKSPFEVEFDFTSLLLGMPSNYSSNTGNVSLTQDPGNYSALHYRSCLLATRWESKSQLVKRAELLHELSWIMKYTRLFPKSESLWRYCLFLIGQSQSFLDKAVALLLHETLEWSRLDISERKWPLLILLMLDRKNGVTTIHNTAIKHLKESDDFRAKFYSSMETSSETTPFPPNILTTPAIFNALVAQIPSRNVNRSTLCPPITQPSSFASLMHISALTAKTRVLLRNYHIQSVIDGFRSHNEQRLSASLSSETDLVRWPDIDLQHLLHSKLITTVPDTLPTHKQTMNNATMSELFRITNAVSRIHFPRLGMSMDNLDSCMLLLFLMRLLIPNTVEHLSLPFYPFDPDNSLLMGVFDTHRQSLRSLSFNSLSTTNTEIWSTPDTTPFLVEDIASIMKQKIVRTQNPVPSDPSMEDCALLPCDFASFRGMETEPASDLPEQEQYSPFESAEDPNDDEPKLENEPKVAAETKEEPKPDEPIRFDQKNFTFTKVEAEHEKLPERLFVPPEPRDKHVKDYLPVLDSLCFGETIDLDDSKLKFIVFSFRPDLMKNFTIIQDKVRVQKTDGISDGGIAALAKHFTHLTSIHLENCTAITDESVRLLVSNTHLKRLILRNCPKVTGVGWFNGDGIQKASLETLEVSGEGSSFDEGVIQTQPSIQQLTFPKFIPTIASLLPNLSFLDFSASTIDIQSSDGIQFLDSLQKLTLSGIRLSLGVSSDFSPLFSFLRSQTVLSELVIHFSQSESNHTLPVLETSLPTLMELLPETLERLHISTSSSLASTLPQKSLIQSITLPNHLLSLSIISSVFFSLFSEDQLSTELSSPLETLSIAVDTATLPSTQALISLSHAFPSLTNLLLVNLAQSSFSPLFTSTQINPENTSFIEPKTIIPALCTHPSLTQFFVLGWTPADVISVLGPVDFPLSKLRIFVL